MNAPLRRVALALGLLFAVLAINANVVQVVHAHALTHNSHNQRLLADDYSRQRGEIVVGGQAIALSTKTNDRLRYLRSYPGGALFADLTGYFSLTLGATGVERSENDVLAGTDDRIGSPISRLSQLITGRTAIGGRVVLTVDRQLQSVAAAALGARRGAVVALNPTTGAVLALVTSPSFDPTPLASHDPATISRAFGALLADPAGPLRDRATSDVYPPGSTFKIITAAAALSSGRFTPATRVPSPTVLTLPGTRGVPLANFNHESCGDGHTDTVADALRISCNSAFAGIGLSLGGAALRRQAELFGLGSVPDGLGLPQVASVFPGALNAPQTAQAAIGQYDVAVTPLQMAEVIAAVANHGVRMRPYVVAEEDGPSLQRLSVASPQSLGQAVSPAVAAALTQMLLGVVRSGTGTAAQIPGVDVAGKTGTAQTAGNPHAWFVGFAPAAAPRIAVAVLVEHGGGEVNATGGSVAAPVAQKVLAAYLAESR